MVNILCCMCGISIEPNPSNTCVTCLASGADVTKGISTEATLHQCRGCQRWHQESGKWIACELESRELMSLCLKNVSGLQKPKGENGEKIRLVDAGWIWTEPHSLRLKVRLTVQKEVHSGTILQQSFVVEFVVRNQQCIECQAEFRQGSWKSLVQVRQRVRHKRTFLYLEQLILKHGAQRGCLSIETFRDGMDFYFPDKGKAMRFISFLENVVPVKTKSSKKLIGTDDKSNISNYKYTNFVEICPLCKDDLLYLPKKIARQMGNIARLVLVKNVTNVVHLIDPLSGQTSQMSMEVFWREPIRPIIIAARSRFTRFIVLGKEAALTERNVSKKTATRHNRNKLAMLTVAKEDDLGVNDTQKEEKSHLGYLFKCGDVGVGYDLSDTQFVDDEAEDARSSGNLPDFVIIRKLYGGVATGDLNAAKQRVFRLQKLDVDFVEQQSDNKLKKQQEMDHTDEEDFLREIEADKDMRVNINLYSSKLIKKSVENQANEDMEQDEDDQKIKLDELLDGLVLDSSPHKETETSPPVTTDEDGLIMDSITEGDRASKDGISYSGRDIAHIIQKKEPAVPVNNTFGKEFMNKKFNFI